MGYGLGGGGSPIRKNLIEISVKIQLLGYTIRPQLDWNLMDEIYEKFEDVGLEDIIREAVEGL